MSTKLPTEAQARKAVPLYSGLVKYFPDALAAVAQLSQIANEQHNPGTPVHWDRSKSTDELDCLLRHLFEAGTIDSDGVRHSTKVAWRALANLQKEIESGAPPVLVPLQPIELARLKVQWLIDLRGKLSRNGYEATASRLGELDSLLT